MHNKISVGLLTAAISLAVCGAAMAQGGDTSSESKAAHKRHGHGDGHRSKRHEYMLKRVDTNEDGKVDLSEYLANAEERFASMDLDGDGYVTTEEHREAGKIMREKHREMRKKMRAERDAESN